MMVILGLLVLIVAVLIAVSGVAANTGADHPVGGDFTIAGLHLSGLSTGQVFLYGIVVGAVAMLGLSMLLGTFSRRMASRASQRKLKGSRRQTQTLLLDHARLTQQLEDERAEHGRAVLSTSTDPAQALGDRTPRTAAMPGDAAARLDEPAPDESAAKAHTGDRPRLPHTIGHRGRGRP